MKLVTIMVEQASVDGLSAALPYSGVSSVTIGEVERGTNDAGPTCRQFRVELLVEDHALDDVMAGLYFAVSVGLMGECRGGWDQPRPGAAGERLDVRFPSPEMHNPGGSPTRRVCVYAQESDVTRVARMRLLFVDK
jgi:hypothetical protein